MTHVDITPEGLPGTTPTWSDDFAGRCQYVETIEMPWQEWVNLADNPIQRDTELHVNRAHHLRRLSPEHRFVIMAINLETDERFKVDGHSRAFIWRAGLLVHGGPPENLSVTVFACEDERTVCELYRHYDSRGAVETGTEQATGALRFADLELQSPLLKHGRFSAAIRTLYKIAEPTRIKKPDPPLIYRATAYFREELILLDQCQPIGRLFPRGVMMAALGSLRRYGPDAQIFWERLAKDKGIKTEDGADAVQIFTEIIQTTQRTIAKNSKSVSEAQSRLLNLGVGAFEGSRRGTLYKTPNAIRMMSSKNLIRWLAGPRRKK